jgi:hypothetical protein
VEYTHRCGASCILEMCLNPIMLLAVLLGKKTVASPIVFTYPACGFCLQTCLCYTPLQNTPACCRRCCQWNLPEIENSQFVLQPYTVQGSTKRFNVTGEGHFYMRFLHACCMLCGFAT